MGELMKSFVLFVLFACFLRLTIQDAITTGDDKPTPEPSISNMTAVPPESEVTTVQTLDETAPIEINISSAVQENKTAVSPTAGTASDQSTIRIQTSSTNDSAVPTSTVQEDAASTQTAAITQTSGPARNATASSSLTTGIENKTDSVTLATERSNTEAVPTRKISETTRIPLTTKGFPNISEATPVPLTTKNFPKISETTRIPLTTKELPKTPPGPITGKTIPTTKLSQVPTAFPTMPTPGPQAIKHGKIVAGLIGGALIAMILGFLVILYKKHKLKKHQIATTDWAGPTPFLETPGGDNGQVTLRSSNRISLSSFLPQRISKRLSLLGETAEEMQDMQELTAGTTFTVNNEDSDKKAEKSEEEMNSGNSVNSTQTEDLVLMNETDNAGDKGKELVGNGAAKPEEGEKGRSENEVKTGEEPPKQTEKETNGQSGKEGSDSAA